MDLRFPGAGGAMVPLSSVGTFRHVLGARVIPRIEKRVAAGVVIRPDEGVSTLELVRRIEEDPPDPKKYLVFYSTMTREEVESRGKFERIVAIGVLLMYLVLVGATESWTRPFALMLSSIPAVAGGIFGVWICGHEFTILAQLALMFLLAFPAGLAVRPVAKASVAFCAALALVLCAAVAFPCVGSSTFGAFAVPLVFGLAVSLAMHLIDREGDTPHGTRVLQGFPRFQPSDAPKSDRSTAKRLFPGGR